MTRPEARPVPEDIEVILYPCIRCGGETGEPLREYCEACLEPQPPDYDEDFALEER